VQVLRFNQHGTLLRRYGSEEEVDCPEGLAVGPRAALCLRLLRHFVALGGAGRRPGCELMGVVAASSGRRRQQAVRLELAPWLGRALRYAVCLVSGI
jgi:hypothetical protein